MEPKIKRWRARVFVILFEAALHAVVDMLIHLFAIAVTMLGWLALSAPRGVIASNLLC